MDTSNPEAGLQPGMVSVVIATYNRASLLPDAVRSCFEQTYGNVEVIIVDDGSTDDSETVVRALMAGEWSGVKVSYWRTANRGPSAARQLGQEKASGEFVQFLDSDDVLMPRKFELQLAAMPGRRIARPSVLVLREEGPNRPWVGCWRTDRYGRNRRERVHPGIVVAAELRHGVLCPALAEGLPPGKGGLATRASMGRGLALLHEPRPGGEPDRLRR